MRLFLRLFLNSVSGKSTQSKALAEKLDFYFIDNKDLYFSRIDGTKPIKENVNFIINQMKNESQLFRGTNINLSENIAAKKIGDAQIDEISRHHLEKGEFNNVIMDMVIRNLSWVYIENILNVIVYPANKFFDTTCMRCQFVPTFQQRQIIL